jgi:hypothetical protein
MPSDDDLRGLAGSQVTVQLTPAGGGGRLVGEVVGILEAADGLVVYVKDAQHTHSVHSQHIATIERQA